MTPARWTEINHRAADALSCMQTDDTDTIHIVDDIPIAVIDPTSNHNDEINLQQVQCQVTVNVVEENKNLPEGAENANYLRGISTTTGNGPFL